MKTDKIKAAFVSLKGGKKEHHNLYTEAAERLNGKNGWDVYPRPQMKREKYLLLNEGWKLDGSKINVPYPPQSLLADYPYEVNENLTYEIKFSVPGDFTKEKILLHFGAVDQIAPALKIIPTPTAISAPPIRPAIQTRSVPSYELIRSQSPFICSKSRNTSGSSIIRRFGCSNISFMGILLCIYFNKFVL